MTSKQFALETCIIKIFSFLAHIRLNTLKLVPEFVTFSLYPVSETQKGIPSEPTTKTRL